jgi:hypothetical protein
VVAQRPRQSGRHLAKPASLDVVGDLGRDEKNGLAQFDGNLRLRTALQFGMRKRRESRTGFQLK